MRKGTWRRRSRVSASSNVEGHVVERKAQEAGLSQLGKTPIHQVKKLRFLSCEQ